MPTALNTIAGDPNQNAYVSLVDANTYHDDRPAVGTTWADADDDAKTRAILFATKLLDSLVEWTGYATTETQGLLWPRSGMVYRNDFSVPSDIIPTELAEATAEYARQLMVSDRAGDSAVETQGITKLKAGPVELNFKDSVAAKAVPDAVVYLLPGDWYTSIDGRQSAELELVRV
jgi:hypothetical protein